MSTWPNLFIVGAPRTGTTSLYNYLGGHPDIYMPPFKEPHFFARVELGGSATTPFFKSLMAFRNEQDYLQLFDRAGTKPVVGEASAHYLFDQLAPLRIHEKVPDAKIIMCLRDPVQRAYSHHSLATQVGIERKPFYEALVEDYARPTKVVGQARLYVESGLYYEQVKRYLGVFGFDRVHIYLYEDFASDTVGVVRDVCEFLELPFYDGRFFDPRKTYNTSGPPRYAIIRMLWASQSLRSLYRILIERRARRFLKEARRTLFHSSKAPKPAMDQRARDFLHTLYAGDIVKLQDLIGRDLGAWLGPEEYAKAYTRGGVHDS